MDLDAADESAATEEYNPAAYLPQRTAVTIRSSQSAAEAALASGGALRVGVLDRRGYAHLGFAASSGGIGHEQYVIESWSFERVAAMPQEPPLSPARAKAKAEEAEQLAAVTAARAAEAAAAAAARAAEFDGSGEEGSGASFDGAIE